MPIGRSPFFELIEQHNTSRYYWELETVGDYSKKAVFISGCDSGTITVLILMLQYPFRIRSCSRYQVCKCGSHCFRWMPHQTGTAIFKLPTCTDNVEGEDTLQAETKGLSLFTCPLDVTKDESVAEARKFVDKNLKKGISE